MLLIIIIIELGILIYLVRLKTISFDKVSEQVKKILRPKTQFLEPISDKEKFEQANSIDDLIL